MNTIQKDSPNIFQIVYVSHALLTLDSEAINSIEAKAVENNKQANITGILLFSNGKFMQFLEGPTNQVEQIFEKIQYDERHHNIKILKKETIPDRQFSGWHMKYTSFDSIHNSHGLIYNKLFDVKINTIEKMEYAMKSMKLLLDFKKLNFEASSL